MAPDLDAATAADRLEASLASISGLLRGPDPALLRRRPAAEGWSAGEVVHHLRDEEREDFRVRLRLLLEDPEAPWPPVDPDGWARERGYAAGDPLAALAELADERRASLAWLRGLGAVDLARAHAHPRLGRVAAGDLLASWVAHDLLHLRQIARVLFRALEEDAAPHRTLYAGVW